MSRRIRRLGPPLVGEIGPPVPDRAGILQERRELGCEDRVAVIDPILRIADQLREAELVRLGVRALRRQAIRQPHLRPPAGETVRRYALAARPRNHMIGGGGAAERPLPVRLALRARWSRRWRSPRWRARWRRSALLPRRTACPYVPACWRSRPGRLSGRTGLRTGSPSNKDAACRPGRDVLPGSFSKLIVRKVRESWVLPANTS
jgi:hypothetical protein